LHRGCNGPIGYDKKCKKCSQQVASQDIVKGYQYEPEQYVIIDPADFEKIKLKSTKIIEIEGFVDAAEIDPMLYESPYYAGPDSEVAGKAYALLCEALRESNRVGVGKVVLREREDAVVIAPHDGGLVLYRLRYPNEVRSIKDVPDLETKRELDKEQLKLARSLVDTMATSFSSIQIRDRYTEALREIIDAKIQGKEIVTVAEEVRPVVDIMSALKQSIEQAKAQRQGMVKAAGTTKKAEPARAKKRA
ncbi:MAG TPA: Ku protein, partial [Acidobacteriota bacterium]|nr:Ku protein [Acidobacteriota bacterium]